MEANDEDIQKRLNQLYSTKELQEKKVSVQNQLMAVNVNERSAVLSVAESSIQIEESMKQRMMQVLSTEESYSHILEQLQDPLQANEVTINDRVFRMKRGLLRVHERNQPEQYSYWRSVVPDDQGIKWELLREIHCVPYSGHPGFT